MDESQSVSDASVSDAPVPMSDVGSDDFRVISVSKGDLMAPVEHTAQAPHGELLLGNSGAGSDSTGDAVAASVRDAGDGRRKRGASSSDVPIPNVENADTTNVPDGGISSGHLKDWIQSAIYMQQSGASFTDMVRKNKNFRNPAIFEKMISYCNIDEFGTELPPDPPLQEHEYYEAIADFQEVCMRESL